MHGADLDRQALRGGVDPIETRHDYDRVILQDREIRDDPLEPAVHDLEIDPRHPGGPCRGPSVPLPRAPSPKLRARLAVLRRIKGHAERRAGAAGGAGCV